MPKLTERCGYSVSVGHRPGGNAMAGPENAVKSAPDGHTLLMQTSSSTALPALHAAAHQAHAENAGPLPTSAEQKLLKRLGAAAADGQLRVPELAARCGVSRERLHRVVKRWIGLSPSEYLRTARLHHAKSLLAATGSPAQAAFECGFSDQAHFTRWFRKAFGYTPGDWLRAAPDSAPGSAPDAA